MTRAERQERPTAEAIAAWRAEIAKWPPRLREVAARWPPWRFVRIASSGAIGKVHGFHEFADGSVTLDVIVRSRWNEHLFWPTGAPDELVTGISAETVESLQ